jgi:DNA polymerase-3 subunit gamma/tau
VWNEFAELKKNQAGEYNLLKRGFDLKENKITISLTNPVEEPMLQSIRTQLTAYLRDKLNNSSVSVFGVMQEFETKKIAYTNKEKFDYLAEKNPILLELKERFGLDADY